MFNSYKYIKSSRVQGILVNILMIFNFNYKNSLFYKELLNFKKYLWLEITKNIFSWKENDYGNNLLKSKNR